MVFVVEIHIWKRIEYRLLLDHKYKLYLGDLQNLVDTFNLAGYFVTRHFNEGTVNYYCIIDIKQHGSNDIILWCRPNVERSRGFQCHWNSSNDIIWCVLICVSELWGVIYGSKTDDLFRCNQSFDQEKKWYNSSCLVYIVFFFPVNSWKADLS